MSSDFGTSAFAELREFDAERELERITGWLRMAVHQSLRRRGAVVGVSGGVDSAVVLALCGRALGAEQVLAVLSPERESAPETIALSELSVASTGVTAVYEELSPVLDAVGCYRHRDEAVAALIPGYTSEWRMKIVLPSVLSAPRLRLFTLVAESPTGERISKRLSADTYRAVVAAMNYKQRTRKMIEYFHADRLGYAVAGTPNRLEYDQGFFVKNGDGAVDLKPIAHLYKTQVYGLAEVLGIPEEIRARTPTTDTYSLEQTQEEFFFSVPLRTLDLCLYAKDNGIDPSVVAVEAGLDIEYVDRIIDEIDAKRRAAEYLHLPPIVLSPDSASFRGRERP